METETSAPAPHLVSVVIPVYQGERTLEGVVDEIGASVAERMTPAGRPYRVTEVVLVHDCGPDDSDAVIRQLAAAHGWVRPVWLSRNFGQHAATLAGIAASGGEWVVTMDEDGQHDPERIGQLIDTAMHAQADVVYARATNAPARTRAQCRLARGQVVRRAPGEGDARVRLRQLASCSARWPVGRGLRRAGHLPRRGHLLGRAAVTTSPMPMRQERDRPSGYDLRALVSHFWRLVLSSGTRPLRWVSALGAAAVLLAPLVALGLIAGRASGRWEVPGWTSTMILLMVATGVILFSLGVIAEYVGMAVNMAMGKPLYLPVRDPRDGPLGRDDA